MNEIHIPQGGSLKLESDEIRIISATFESLGVDSSCIDFEQEIVNFPQAYVGYISLPDRKVIIDPKHRGVSFKHIMRIYYFLYTSDSSDLDEPIYDVDGGNTYDVVQSFIRELDIVVKKGLPVEYKTEQDTLQYLRGNVNLIRTNLNLHMGRKEIFDCEYDALSHDIPINQVLYKALIKTSQMVDIGIGSLLKRNFHDVSDVHDIPKDIVLNTNTKYCKKVLTLAYMILNDLSISDYGNSSYGQNLLINFDRVFEEFIKKVLTVYSGDYNFTYWDEEKNYAICRTNDGEFYKSYIPDMLYGYQDKIYPNSAYCILDMKNKISKPFSNADVYQMFFYANQLSSKKIILCYPSSENVSNAVLKFDNDAFSVKKIYAAYINISGDTSKEFKANIYSFIEKVKSLL